jgi:hypothetical protein
MLLMMVCLFDAVRVRPKILLLLYVRNYFLLHFFKKDKVETWIFGIHRIFWIIYTLRRVILDTMGTRMTRIERIFADFFLLRSKFGNLQKKSAKICSIRVIRVIRAPIVSKTTRHKVIYNPKKSNESKIQV